MKIIQTVKLYSDNCEKCLCVKEKLIESYTDYDSTKKDLYFEKGKLYDYFKYKNQDGVDSYTVHTYSEDFVRAPKGSGIIAEKGSSSSHFYSEDEFNEIFKTDII